MKFSMKLQSIDFAFPIADEPLWADQIGRWYQLDRAGAGFATCAAELAHRAGAPVAAPDVVILPNGRGSFDADKEFADSKGQSPSRFSATLPNIRASYLCNILDWQPPLFCLNRGVHSLFYGFQEALWALKSHKSVLIPFLDAKVNRVHFLWMHPHQDWEEKEIAVHWTPGEGTPNKTDEELIAELVQLNLGQKLTLGCASLEKV
jgi:hypothetical protein